MNIITNVISIVPYDSKGGPYGNGYWLIDISEYILQSKFVYLFLNVSQPGLVGPSIPIYWQERVVNSSGRSASNYSEMAYNTQVSYYTTGGTFIQVSSPSGTGGGIVSLY